jgi:hypothetical protein
VRKDFVRDYATEMFREYAALGKPSAELLTRMLSEADITSRSYETNALRTLLDSYKNAERMSAVMLDIAAVEKTIGQFQKADKKHIIKAVEAVYFASAKNALKKGDISARVRRFAMDLPASEKQVYKWLREARLLCAANRGLRIPEVKR